MLKVPADGAGKDDALQIAAAGDEVFDLIAMRNASDILLDDGTIIEDTGDVVAGGADELDATRMGCVVWPRTDERRQKRVMHVDDRGWIAGDEVFREDLHVASEDDEFDAQLFEQQELMGFSFHARFCRYGNVFEPDAVEHGELFHFAMIGDDDCDFAGQFVGADAMQQVCDAVQVLRAEERDPRFLVHAAKLPAHVQFFGERREGLGEVGNIGTAIFHCPLDAHEKQAQLMILMLIGMEDVGALLVEKAGDARYQAFLVWAVDEENCAVVAGR